MWWSKYNPCLCFEQSSMIFFLTISHAVIVMIYRSSKGLSNS